MTPLSMPVPATSLPEAVAAARPALWVRLADVGVGLLERRRTFPSQRAWSEALDYYEGLYQDRGPDPLCFERLLARNGLPAWANPFPEGHERHFRFHPQGLMLADLEAILQDLSIRLSAFPMSSETGSIDTLAWPSLEQAEQHRTRAQQEQERAWSRSAAVCWGMALVRSGSIAPLQAMVHADNLAWATSHAVSIAPWKAWGMTRKQVLDAAVRHGVLRAPIAAELLAAMELP